jgi:hypothetical protein
MRRHSIRAICLGVLSLTAALSLVRAEEPAAGQAAAEEADKVAPLPAGAVLTPEEMSARIDQYIAARWAEVSAEKNEDGSNRAVRPAPRADDAEFFRRLSLDLNGRIPSITQLTDFLDDTREDKRRIWTDELMQGRDNGDLYVNHFATFWRTLLFPPTINVQFQFNGFNMDPFFRNHVKNNTPYDQFVREVLTGPQAQQFYQASEGKPEVIAANTARLFLGVKVECAQCHDDRSGGSWTRVQFWEFAAFFGNRTGNGAQITIPDKKQTVQAKFLDGTAPQWQKNATPQQTVAEWMTNGSNPYFAKAIVNRMWGYFLGVGIVDPVDNASEANPASHPELLDELAAQFVANKFDMRWLIRAITGSQAYQMTSARSHESQDDVRIFARMTVRGMTPEQLWDSIAEATGYKDNTPVMNQRFGFPNNNSPRAEFLNRFANSVDKRTETHTSILQALFLMNGKLMNDVTDLEKLPDRSTLKTIITANDQIPTSRRLSELFIITLSRKPTAKEMDKLVAYIESGGPAKDRKKAMSDIFWALLNSGEFSLNH